MKFIPCLLTVALSCLGTWGQIPREKQGRAGEEFHFQTRGGDSCVMHPSSLGQGAGEVKLRVDCHNQGQEYWCEYRGQPGVCPAFTANPEPYWNQTLQELRHLGHACWGAPVLKPSVCQKAGPQAHMQQVASSSQDSPAPTQLSETAKTGKLSPGPGAPVKPTEAMQLGNAKPTTQPMVKAIQHEPRPEGDEEAEKMARQLCWEPFQALCAYVFSLFRWVKG
ncbi:fibroblast growth factor-binding protein 2 [Cynocephalus volans]|uniref:fibroblast growth factor-binding protein 2 n=1 Tax=Cynocephalus volans TaxID=110931 RepID=UPI002FC82EDA